jgi:hypothetical protein
MPKQPQFVAVLGHSEAFDKWIRTTFGVSRTPVESFERDDDWTFVIKTHVFVEAALNHLILSQLNDPKLATIISKLETNNASTGKMAFINAYNLLQRDDIHFIRALSSVRNAAVHNIAHLELDLRTYVASLDSGQLKNWKAGMTCWTMGGANEGHREDTVMYPRHAIFSCCIYLMGHSHPSRTARDRGKSLSSDMQFLSAMDDLWQVWIYKHDKSRESNPTE